MTHYFFDTFDGDTLIEDDVGLELDDIDAARDQATRGIADMARFTIPGAVRKELAVDVRDAAKRLLLRASLWFEVAAVA